MILDKKFYEAHGVLKGSLLWLRALAVSLLTNLFSLQRYLEKKHGPEVSWPMFKKTETTNCQSCDLCVKICPSKALSQESSAQLWLTLSQCTQCGLCVETCPQKVLEMGHDHHLAFHNEQKLRFALNGKAV